MQKGARTLIVSFYCSTRTAGRVCILPLDLAFARYSFTSRLFCTNQPSFHSPRSSALPTLVQYHCATIGQYTIPFRPPVFTPCTTQYCALQYRVKANSRPSACSAPPRLIARVLVPLNIYIHTIQIQQTKAHAPRPAAPMHTEYWY